MSEVYHITYVSRMTLTAGFSPATLVKINEVSQMQNPTHRVTGFLCFGNGYFFQYIEGEKKDIVQLFANIQKDSRNHNVTLMTEGFKDERLFSDWKLLMVNINNPNTHKDVIRIFKPMMPGVSKQEQAEKLIKAMQSQYERRNVVNFEEYSYRNVSHYGVSVRALLLAHQRFLIVQSILIVLILLSLINLVRDR